MPSGFLMDVVESCGFLEFLDPDLLFDGPDVGLSVRWKIRYAMTLIPDEFVDVFAHCHLTI